MPGHIGPRTLAACLLVLAALASGAAPAADLGPLYEAQTIVTGQREETRVPGFAACLTDVLVKVSGDPRLAADPRVAAMAGRAGAFVGAYRYRDRMSAGIQVHDEQGTRDRPYDLVVTFKDAEVDAALRSLGREPWTGERPRVAVLLGVRDATTAYVLASDGERGLGQREALAAAAERRGMPVALPSGADLAAAGLGGFDALLAAGPTALDPVARAAGGEVVLVGGMAWGADPPGWTSDWRLLRPRNEAASWRARDATFDEAFRAALGGVAQVLSENGRPG